MLANLKKVREIYNVVFFMQNINLPFYGIFIEFNGASCQIFPFGQKKL